MANGVGAKESSCWRWRIVWGVGFWVVASGSGSWALPLKTTSANNKFSAGPNKKKLVPGQLVGNRVERVAMRFKLQADGKRCWEDGKRSREVTGCMVFYIHTHIHLYTYIFIHFYFFIYIAGSLFLGSHATLVLIKLLYIRWQKLKVCVRVSGCVCIGGRERELTNPHPAFPIPLQTAQFQCAALICEAYLWKMCPQWADEPQDLRGHRSEATKISSERAAGWMGKVCSAEL